MAKSKSKYYVVWQGVNPGIYDNWNECNLQIKGYPGAKYKSFKSKEEAEQAFGSSFDDHIGGKETKKKAVLTEDLRSEINWKTISVDAACSGNPGKMEYRGVHTEDAAEIFRMGPFAGGTNNVGEFLAIVHALALLKKSGDKTSLYSDSRTAMKWVRDKRANTKLKKDRTTRIIWEMIGRAENWLKQNSYPNEILKWETKRWGEIPADFGRK